jgi:hypothetical protein
MPIREARKRPQRETSQGRIGFGLERRAWPPGTGAEKFDKESKLFDKDRTKDIKYDIKTSADIEIESSNHCFDLFDRFFNNFGGRRLISARGEQLGHQLSKSFRLFSHQIEVGLAV